jgi:hypothetical protein
MDDEFLGGDFLSELDKAFVEIQMVPEKPSKSKATRRSKRTATDAAAMHETFLGVAQLHLRPVLRYLKAIHLGVASKDLCEIVHYVVGPIIGKTRNVGLEEHTRALIAFQRALKAAVKGTGRRLSAEQSADLSRTFAPVQMLFDLDFRGHSAAVVNLLGFYRALRKNRNVTSNEISKLFAIGIPSLTMLRKSSIEELTSLSGIRPDKMGELRLEARRFSILSLV